MFADTVTIEIAAVRRLDVTDSAPFVAAAIRRAFRAESLSNLCVRGDLASRFFTPFSE